RHRAKRYPQRPGVRLHGFLEFLGGTEGDLLAGLDLNWLTGRGIAAHARCALAHDQDAEPTDADAVALLGMLGQEADEIAENRLGLLLRHFVGFREICGEMLERYGRRSARFLRCHGWPSSFEGGVKATLHTDGLDDSDTV